MKKILKSLFFTILFSTLCAAGVAFYGYYLVKLQKTNLEKSVFVYITPDDNATTVMQKIENAAKPKSTKGFELLAKHNKFDDRKRSGKFAINDGDNMYTIYRRIVSNEQTPVKLVVPSTRTLPQLVGAVSRQLMLDSLELSEFTTNKTYISKIGYSEESLPSLFIPNTYEVYWDIKPEKLMPQKLIDQVQVAMSQGDIVAAMEACQATPCAMSNILLAAFSHVEEGFDVIQEAVTAASDFEQEKLMQRLTWISVCSNLGPSLGLLGTVQGMILTFQALAAGNAGDAAALASSIGQALWTTAGGLIVSIPSITAFYSLRNNANRRILRMTAVTMEFLNSLRNVEVAPEEAV